MTPFNTACLGSSITADSSRDFLIKTIESTHTESIFLLMHNVAMTIVANDVYRELFFLFFFLPIMASIFNICIAGYLKNIGCVFESANRFRLFGIMYTFLIAANAFLSVSRIFR